MRKTNSRYSSVIFRETFHFTKQFCRTHRQIGSIENHSLFSFVSITKSKNNRFNEYFHERKKLLENFNTRLIKTLKIDEYLSLDSFDIIRQLGQGGFGSVFLVYDKHSHDYLALKAIQKSELIAINKQNLIHSERQYAFALDHPNIVKFINSFQDNEYLYLVFEWLQGGDLFSLMLSQNLTELQAQFYAAQIVLSLDYLHECKIVFRDLKPENIVFTQRGYIKLIDLGLAKLVRGYTKTFCGTPHYIAPEVIRQCSYRFSPDFWTLGIIIHEMITGVPPFDRTDIESSLSTIETDISEVIESTSKHYNMYIRILNGCSSLQFDNLSANCVSLIKNLLQDNVEQRLGCGQHGMLDLFEHPWFEQIDFWKLYQQTYVAPFLPIRKSLFTNDIDTDDQQTILKLTAQNQYDHEFLQF